MKNKKVNSNGSNNKNRSFFTKLFGCCVSEPQNTLSEESSSRSDYNLVGTMLVSPDTSEENKNTSDDYKSGYEQLFNKVSVTNFLTDSSDDFLKEVDYQFTDFYSTASGFYAKEYVSNLCLQVPGVKADNGSTDNLSVQSPAGNSSGDENGKGIIIKNKSTCICM